MESASFQSIKENDIRIGKKIVEANDFLINLKRYIKKYDNLVFICNEPKEYERNDTSAQFISGAFKDGLCEFKHVQVLDKRTKKYAKNILLAADVVFICGGKIPRQNKFLKQIKFEKYITQTDAVVIGESAGAMNMGDIVYNYPEEDSDVKDARWLKGVGLSSVIVIPHYVPRTGNKFCMGNFNLLKDYYLPQSKGNVFYALTDGAYILVENGHETIYGKCYLIRDGKICIICSDDRKKEIKTKVKKK